MNPTADKGTLYIDSARVPVVDTHMDPCDEGPTDFVTLWRVAGIPGMYYPTKVVAEVEARLRFPDEDVDRRYARISYRTFASCS